MPLTFPATPVVGQIVTQGTRRWSFDGVGWTPVFPRKIAYASDKGASPTAAPLDNTVAIQAAIDSLGNQGGWLIIDDLYPVTQSPNGNYCLRIRQNVSIICLGMYYGIMPTGIANTVPNILIQPDPNHSLNGMAFTGLHIGNPADGTRQGGHAIFADTAVAGAYLPQFYIGGGTWIGQGSGLGFIHVNDPSQNPNGGLYGSLFENFTSRNGISLQSSGDSIILRDAIITGPQLGFYASMVAGASQLKLWNLNMTAALGQICIDAGRRVHVLGGNFEQTVALNGANDGSLVNFRGGNGTLAQVWLDKTNMGVFQNGGATNHYRFNNTQGGRVKDCQMISAGVMTPGSISATCRNIKVGPNQYGSNITTKVSDSGIGTMGVSRPLTLQSNWVAYNATYFASATIEKDEEGWVTVTGAIKGGDTNYGNTVLFQAPDGFRPAQIEVFTITTLNPGYGPASVLISTDGSCVLNSGGNTGLFLNGIRYRCIDGGDNTSDL